MVSHSERIGEIRNLLNKMKYLLVFIEAATKLVSPLLQVNTFPSLIFSIIILLPLQLIRFRKFSASNFCDIVLQVPMFFQRAELV